MRSGSLTKYSSTISVIDLPKGVYLLRIKNVLEVTTQKVIIK